MTDRGTHIEHDGRPAVRFERTFRHPVERVWRAISDPAELPAWFPSKVEYEQRVGASIRFVDDPYAPGLEGGTVLAWDPPRHLAFTWGEDELHFTLEEVEGGCRFELVNVLADPGKSAMNAAGWHVCLDELAKLVRGALTDGPHADAATPWRPLYDGYVADGFDHSAPLPDGV